MVNSESWLTLADAYLRERGLFSLRPGQREVLRALAQGSNVLTCLPTGYGKSACYFLPAAAWGWRVWVISPLLSLMEDQRKAGELAGVRCLAWTAHKPRHQLRREMESGNWQICFLSPERFRRWHETGYLQALAGAGLDADLLVIDEMHCLEDWRGFRSGYAALTQPARAWVDQGTKLLGLSASLSADSGSEWMRELGARHCVVSTGLGRENLRLRVLGVETEEERWLALVAALRALEAPFTALVYCSTREECDDVNRFLRSIGMSSVPFHAGLPSEERRERVRAFREGRLRVVCATVAFGMGVDYPHVDRVVHFSVPKDLESYWQEVGRAGRSGNAAWGLALWRRSEITRARAMSARERERFAALWDAWASGGCLKQAVSARLGMEEASCGVCDRCAGGEILPLLQEWKISPWWTLDREELRDWVRRKIRDFYSGL